MRGGGDDVGVREGRGDHAGRHEAADVRHVGQKPRAGRVRDLLHARVVDVAGVRARPGDNELGFSAIKAAATAVAAAAVGTEQKRHSRSGKRSGI